MSAMTYPLKNLGNTCYMNAVVEALVGCREFRNYFIGNKYLAKHKKEERLVSKFAKLLKRIVIRSEEYNDEWIEP